MIRMPTSYCMHQTGVIELLSTIIVVGIGTRANSFCGANACFTIQGSRCRAAGILGVRLVIAWFAFYKLMLAIEL